MFMEARRSSRLTRLFVPVDPANPCRQWQAMAKLAGIVEQGDWRCERSGEEKIGGRDTIHYRALWPSGRQFSGWIDAVRKFPLRIETQDGAIITAENIRDETQPAESFEMPNSIRVRSSSRSSKATCGSISPRMCRKPNLDPHVSVLPAEIITC
jgi:hypothetical protein